MLAKKFRLNKEKDILKVMKTGKKGYGKLLTIRFYPNKEANNRFCFIISNKISKKSTKRNKIRRWMREVVGKNLAKIKGNFDIVFMANLKTDILEKDYSDINSEIGWLLDKNGLLKEKK